MPSYQMGIQSGMPGANTTGTVQPYHPGPPPAPIVYHPMMPPSHFPQHLEASQRYPKPEPAHDPSSPRHQHLQQANPMHPVSPVIQTAHPSSLSLSRRLQPDVKSPVTSTSKQHSPLSLASITSPFNSESQSKNCHAQTLILGERLRPGYQALEDPANPSSADPLKRAPQRRQTLPSCSSIIHQAHLQPSRCNQPPGVLVTHPIFSQASHQHGMMIESV